MRMNVNGRPYRTIWLGDDGLSVEIIDQTRLPHAFEIVRLTSLDEAARAIRDMQVRGAPLIGVTAAYGLALAMRADASDAHLAHACSALAATRPTAVNLRWALDRVRKVLASRSPPARAVAAYAEAARMADEDVETNKSIGKFGFDLISRIARLKAGMPVHILTHCNASWLATVDWGTATAPIYTAHEAGIPLHVWVDETRPRNQGAALTAWELGGHGVPHTVIVDNAGGHLMQHDQVDMVIVGSDRTTATGDVCNKIGTYLKALAARDNGVPFYVALPSSTIDFTMSDGIKEIPIEERAADEVAWISGATAQGEIARVRLVPEGADVANYAFDVTPARLVNGLVTERGVIAATRDAIASAFPERVLSK
jgi:methylthioribose-1-phosphate isomerase